MSPGVLVYDADCSFCTRFASWGGTAVPWQDLDLETAGTTEDVMSSAAGWLVDGRVTATGSGAIAEALVQHGGVPAVAGRVIRLPVVRLVAELAYAAIARNRHRMPGGTPACEIPKSTSGPPRAVMVSAMVAIALAGVGALGYANTHEEPYPALLMPGFGYVPDDGHHVHASRVTYAATMGDGRVVTVSPESLIPDAGPASYVMAQRALTGASVQDVAVRRWVAEQLDQRSTTSGAVSLVVTRHSLTYDSADHALVSDAVTSRTTLDLGDFR